MLLSHNWGRIKGHDYHRYVYAENKELLDTAETLYDKVLHIRSFSDIDWYKYTLQAYPTLSISFSGTSSSFWILSRKLDNLSP